MKLISDNDDDDDVEYTHYYDLQDLQQVASCGQKWVPLPLMKNNLTIFNLIYNKDFQNVGRAKSWSLPK